MYVLLRVAIARKFGESLVIKLVVSLWSCSGQVIKTYSIHEKSISRIRRKYAMLFKELSLGLVNRSDLLADSTAAFV